VKPKQTRAKTRIVFRSSLIFTSESRASFDLGETTILPQDWGWRGFWLV